MSSWLIRCESFRAATATMPVDRKLVEGAGHDLESVEGVRVEYYSSGNLKRLERSKGKSTRKLELDEKGGAGRYESETSSYWLVESYANGRETTTLNSPWHDGCRHEAEATWLRWVFQQISSVVSWQKEW